MIEPTANKLWIECRGQGILEDDNHDIVAYMLLSLYIAIAGNQR
jgi:hypothetical protein